ncbi:MAG: CBS domain-containing protein [Candidatus Bathyarchaeia archaeon]
MEPMKNVSVGNFVSEAISVDPLEQVSKVVGLMKEKDAYEVFSIAGDKIGTVTIRDLLKVKSFTDAKIESFLNFLPKLSVNTDLFQAARIMTDYRLRALPVVERDKIIGKFDVKAIINEVKNSSLGNISASKIMTPSPTTATAGEKVANARGVMIRRRFDHLPVIRGRKIGGMVTSSQIVFNLIPNLKGRYIIGVPEDFKPLDWPVDVIMDTNPLECAPQDSIKAVANSMLQRNLSYCLVAIGEELQGIITYRDFAKLVSEGERKIEVPVYMVGLPDDPFEAEAAKIKFVRLVEGLSRTHWPLMEARSTIKTSSSQGSRRRYEVSVSIKTPKETHNYTYQSWDLPSIYDELANRIKKIMKDKEKMRRRERGIKKGEILE